MMLQTLTNIPYQVVKWFVRGYNRATRALYTKVVYYTHRKTITVLQANDRVVAEGSKGTVLRVYRSKETNEIEFCSVKWDKLYHGEPITLLMPIGKLQMIEIDT